MRNIALTTAAVLTAFALATPAFAAGGHNNHGVRSYGPFTSGSSDSGTCGNDWANDTYKRFFLVDPSNPNTLTEEFRNGHFVTIAGVSPGNCETDPAGNATVGDGVKGTFEGSFTIVVTGGTYNPHAVCTAHTCDTTAGFIATVYGPDATYDIPTFEFHYNAGHNGSWTNASADRGGNSGDITGNPPQHHGNGHNDGNE